LPLIRVESLKKSFGSKTILNGVTFHFPEGERLALVGANGAGKTTLLDILTGVAEADSGQILKPNRLRLGYLPQEPNPTPMTSVIEEAVIGGDGYIQSLVRRHRAALQEMTANYSEASHRAWEMLDEEYKSEGGYSLESEAMSILSGLGFHGGMIAKDPSELSGGWRMRLELAKIFLNKPNFLVLDEPTNHLDLPSLVWVEKWLQSFKGTLLFVSHDRSLLRRLPTSTLHLQNGVLTRYSGNFDSFLEQREMQQELVAAQADTLRKRREHLESFVTRFGAKATKAAQAQSKMKMIARIRDLESDVVGEEDVDAMHVEIPLGQPSGRSVLSIKDGAIGYSQPLSRGINLLVERGHKVAVIGANGIGKSTLLKTVVGDIGALNGSFEIGHNVRLAWFAQDQLSTLNPEKSILENTLDASPKATQGLVRNLLGSLLFRGDDVYKNVKVLSGGEKARVGLARLLMQEANFLVLDEPTNHLDISSCEVLSQAITDFEGTALFVSHDREFIDSVCTHVYAMLPDGRGRLFEGKLADYEMMADKSGFPNVLSVQATSAQQTDKNPRTTSPTPETSAKISEQEVNRLKKEAQKNQKNVEKLDLEMSRLQRLIADCDSQMEQCHSDFNRVAALSDEKRGFEQQLAEYEEEWLDLSEKVESVRQTLMALGRTL
jgi:ATP-binding cassette subfamily F protein 3